MDTHYVKTTDLIKYLQQYVDLHGMDYTVLRLGTKRHLPEKLSKSGEYTTIKRILSNEAEFTELKVADRVLIAIDCTHVLPRKELRVYTRSEALQQLRSLDDSASSTPSLSKSAEALP